MNLVVLREVLLPLMLGIIGVLVGQINLVCYNVLPCGDNEKEKPVFKKENFNNGYSLWYALPTAILYPMLYLKYGGSAQFIVFSLLGTILIPIFTVDIKHKIIPDKLNIFGYVIGIIYLIYLGMFSNMSLLINHILGGTIGAGIFFLLAGIGFLIYGKESMGFGDVKLMGMLGLIFGIKDILVLTLIAFALGAVVCIVLLVSRKCGMKDYIPFGPFICIASFILMFVSSGFFVDWYFNMLI